MDRKATVISTAALARSAAFHAIGATSRTPVVVTRVATIFWLILQSFVICNFSSCVSKNDETINPCDHFKNACYTFEDTS